MFRFNQTIIREPTICGSLKLQYWCQLKYWVIELFGRVATRRTPDFRNIATYCRPAVKKLHYSTRWRSRLKHCPTNQKVAGLIHSGVTEIVHSFFCPHCGPGFDSSSDRNEYQDMYYYWHVPWLRFYCALSSVVRQMPGYTLKDGARSALYLISELCRSMYCLFRMCCSVYCLCVNVYCTTATG
jgi:hypothetical protein